MFKKISLYIDNELIHRSRTLPLRNYGNGELVLGLTRVRYQSDGYLFPSPRCGFWLEPAFET